MKNVLKNMDKEVNERNEQANRQPSEQELIERFKLRELKIVLTKLKQKLIVGVGQNRRKNNSRNYHSECL